MRETATSLCSSLRCGFAARLYKLVELVAVSDILITQLRVTLFARISLRLRNTRS